jgi:hypothetical protein
MGARSDSPFIALVSELFGLSVQGDAAQINARPYHEGVTWHGVVCVPVDAA